MFEFQRLVVIATEHEIDSKLGLGTTRVLRDAKSPAPARRRGVAPRMTVPGAAPEDVPAAAGAGDGEKLMGAIWYGHLPRAQTTLSPLSRKRASMGSSPAPLEHVSPLASRTSLFGRSAVPREPPHARG